MLQQVDSTRKQCRSQSLRNNVKFFNGDLIDLVHHINRWAVLSIALASTFHQFPLGHSSIPPTQQAQQTRYCNPRSLQGVDDVVHSCIASNGDLCVGYSVLPEHLSTAQCCGFHRISASFASACFNGACMMLSSSQSCKHGQTPNSFSNPKLLAQAIGKTCHSST